MPPTERWNAELYPEVEAANGLTAALRLELARFAVDLDIEERRPSIEVASISHGSRRSEVTMVVARRHYFVRFWDAGEFYGNGYSQSLEEIARAIVAFLGEHDEGPQITQRFPWLVMYEVARERPEGAEALVGRIWTNLVKSLNAQEPFDDPRKALAPLVVACMRRPRLRALMPFTSHGRLFFSRATEYPFTWNGPFAIPLDDGRFRVVLRDSVNRTERTLDGDAEVSADALENAIPPDWGAAIIGTANDLAAQEARSDDSDGSQERGS
jgi:hypothetical protein